MSSESPTTAVDRWRRLSELFEQSLDLPPAEREAFLDRQAGQDRTLRRALETLLAADQDVEQKFLEEPPIVMAAVSEPCDLPPPTDRIGPYVLVKKIGEGGMGTVFLARRDDEAFEREVAIKVIRRGMESAEAVRRLLVERQILARLEHPSIARLYDGGTTPEGLPYFVMEYVDGLQIDSYCNERQLTVDEQVVLSIEICGAVAYAHRNLVVHRDLKPSNVLVTADGALKLLDFGIAKLLDPSPRAAETASWQRFLSPRYASPEQIDGRPITTTSDVYSLGVLLYKLLTGRLPFDFEGRSLAEIRHLLATQEPEPPSAAVRRRGRDGAQAAGRGRELRGDLDHIVLKALRSRAADRYSSVDELAEDLRSYRGGFPVKARRGNVRYRTGKFLRRNWAAAAVAVSLVALISAFVLDKARQNDRLVRALAKTAEERDRARQERDQKEQVIQWVVELFELADPSRSQGQEVTVRDVLDHSDRLLARFEEQPAVEATLHRVVGWTYLNLDLIDSAEVHLERSLELTRRLYGEESVEAALAASRFAFIPLWREKPEQARSTMEEAVARIRRSLGDNHPALIEPLNHLVTLLCYLDDIGAADELSREALLLARQHSEAGSAEMAEATVNRAAVLKNQGVLEEAERLYQEALEIHGARTGEVHPQVAAIFNNLGTLSDELGRLEDAERFHRRALAIRRQLYPEGHSEIAQSLNHVARLKARQGDAQGAESAYLEALELLRELHGRDHGLTILPSVGLARLWTESGKPREAERLLREGLGLWRKRLRPKSGFLAWAESALGGVLIVRERFDEATDLLERSLAVLQETYGPEDERTRDGLRWLAVVWEKRGDAEKAASYRCLLAESGAPAER